MIPSPSLHILCAVVRLAGQSITLFRGFAQACRPVAAPLLLQRVKVVLPSRRAVSTICASSISVRVQGQCLLLREQWSTDPWARASKNLGQFIQGEGV